MTMPTKRCIKSGYVRHPGVRNLVHSVLKGISSASSTTYPRNVYQRRLSDPAGKQAYISRLSRASPLILPRPQAVSDRDERVPFSPELGDCVRKDLIHRAFYNLNLVRTRVAARNGRKSVR